MLLTSHLPPDDGGGGSSSGGGGGVDDNFVFWNRVFPRSLGCPRMSYVDQANLELRDPPIPATRVL